MTKKWRLNSKNFVSNKRVCFVKFITFLVLHKEHAKSRQTPKDPKISESE